MVTTKVEVKRVRAGLVVPGGLQQVREILLRYGKGEFSPSPRQPCDEAAIARFVDDEILAQASSYLTGKKPSGWDRGFFSEGVEYFIITGVGICRPDPASDLHVLKFYHLKDSDLELESRIAKAMNLQRSIEAFEIGVDTKPEDGGRFLIDFEPVAEALSASLGLKDPLHGSRIVKWLTTPPQDPDPFSPGFTQHWSYVMHAKMSNGTTAKVDITTSGIPLGTKRGNWKVDQTRPSMIRGAGAGVPGRINLAIGSSAPLITSDKEIPGIGFQSAHYYIQRAPFVSLSDCQAAENLTSRLMMHLHHFLKSTTL